MRTNSIRVFRFRGATALLLVALLTLYGRMPSSAEPRDEHGQTLPTRRHRRALLVAVTGYKRASVDPEDVWPTINTLPDVIAIESELINRFHYDPSDIKVLSTPDETTHASIVGWFKKWLIDDTVPGRGDEIYFHYSGHGGEVPNDDTLTGDLDPFHEPDGYDKTLIPSDYGHKDYFSTTVAIPKLDGKPVCNEIRDSELKRLLLQLEGRRPGDVFLTFDCCHAGGNTRGGGSDTAAVRGDIWHGPPPLLRRQSQPRAAAAAVAARGSRGAADVPDVAADFPGFVVLAATNSDQLDSETIGDDGRTHMGPLAYALCKAMDRATPTMSYRDLMSEVNTIMAIRVPAQTPQIEGPIDRAVFDGAAVPPPPTIDVLLRDPDDPKDPDESKLQPLLQAGFLQGMVSGSTVALRWRGETIRAAPFATATLADVGGLQSTLRFDPPSAAGKGLTAAQIVKTMRGAMGEIGGKGGAAPHAVYAVLTKQVYRNEPLAVAMAPDLPPEEAAALRKALSRLEGDHWASLAPSESVPPAIKTPQRHWDLKIITAGAARREMPVTRGGNPAFPLPRDDSALVIAQQSGGYIVPAAPGSNPTPAQIESAIRGEAKRRLFASLDTPPTNESVDDAMYKVEFRFVPIDARAELVDGTPRLRPGTMKDKPMPLTGQTQFTEGDVAVLELCNVGKHPAYVTILNLRGDGTVSPVYPLGSDPDDNRVVCQDYTEPPGKRPWRRMRRRDGSPILFGFTARDKKGVPFPSQADIYKIFVTKEEADFRLLVDPDARSTRGGGPVAGADTQLYRLIQRATSANRGPDAVAEPPNSGWTVSTVTYNVLPANPANAAGGLGEKL